MFNPSSEMPATTVRTSDTLGKRRRIRKGTRSCWECKRRKIRCIFASSEDVTCLNCQRRHVPCVSQEVPEDLSLAKRSNWHLAERIAKVEDLIQDILVSKNVGCSDQPEGEILLEGRPSSSEVSAARSNDVSPSLFLAPPTPVEVSKLAMPNLYIYMTDSFRLLQDLLRNQQFPYLTRKVHRGNPSPRSRSFITSLRLSQHNGMPIYCSKRVLKHRYIPISSTFNHIASGHRRHLLDRTL